MFDSDYYPPGAYNDPRAPYNEVDNEEVDVEVVASNTLSRSAIITTTEYTAEKWEDWDTDDEGHPIHDGGIDYDFSECNFKEEFTNKHFTIPDLLDILVELAKENLEYYTKGVTHRQSINKLSSKQIHSKIAYYTNLVEEAKSWEEDELEVEEE